MHQLSKIQKVENLEELIKHKEDKVNRLKEEIINLKKKKAKLESSETIQSKPKDVISYLNGIN